jgi:hypothetical protein
LTKSSGLIIYNNYGNYEVDNHGGKDQNDRAYAPGQDESYFGGDPVACGSEDGVFQRPIQCEERIGMAMSKGAGNKEVI